LALLRQVAAADSTESAKLPDGLFKGHSSEDERLRRDFTDLIEEGLVRVERFLRDGSGAYAVLIGARVTAKGNEVLGRPSGRDAERALNALRAMWFGNSRPPGHLGRTTRLSGRVGSVPSTLDRTDGGWILRSGNEAVQLSAGDAATRLLDGSFIAKDSLLIPEITDILFIQAIRQASESVAKLNQAREGLDAVRTAEAGNPFPAIFVESALDRSVAASLSAQVLVVAACESQANEWAPGSGGWTGDQDWLPVVEKLRELARRHGHAVDLGQGAFQKLTAAVKRRNDVVHPKPIAVTAALSGSKVVLPGLSASLDARGACLAVRECLIATAGMIGESKPKYLAYCPPGAVDDDVVWATAELLTGVREDPDFPKVVAD
jgi:hypothetical protein